VADKLTQQLTDALARAAADPGGQLLFATKTEPGLFPATAKAAAQKCVADGLIYASATDTKGRSPRELFALTEKGWEYLLAQVNPKQVLEDFVRVLEARQGEVGELLGTARRMADSLQGLKDAVSRVLPKVSAAKIQQPNPPTPFPLREGGADLLPSPLRGGHRRSASSTMCCANSRPRDRWRCTRGPALCTPCPNRPTRCWWATASPTTRRCATQESGDRNQESGNTPPWPVPSDSCLPTPDS
jgi:hypothetical protein